MKTSDNGKPLLHIDQKTVDLSGYSPDYQAGYKSGSKSAISKKVIELTDKNNALSMQLSNQQRNNQVLSTLLQISELTHDFALEIDSLYSQIHSQLDRIINTSNFYIARLDTQEQTLRFVYYKDTHGATFEYPQDFPIRKVGNGVTEMVIRTNEVVLLSKSKLEELFHKGKVAKRQLYPESWLGAPLMYGDENMGAIVVQSYDKEFQYGKDDAELLKFVAQHIATAIKRHEEKVQEHQYKKRLAFEAAHDKLTGLKNRSSLYEMLDELLHEQSSDLTHQFSVFFIDLDGFKAVNDNFGHAIGDELLITVAKIFKKVIRTHDLIFRLGGDEFVVILTELLKQNDAILIAQRIITELTQPISVSGNAINIGTSIGIAFNTPCCNTSEEILKRADASMYAAKNNGKNRYEVFVTN